MHWFTLTLISAISLAASDALTKKFLTDYQGWELLLIRLGVPALLLLPFTILYPIPPVPMIFTGWMAVLVPLELVAMFLYMVAIRDSPLFLTLPYLAFTPVFTILTGYLFLGETVSWQGLSGILLVVTGAYILNINHTTKTSWLAPLLAITREHGSRLMLVAASIYSITSVLGKHTMGFTTPESFGPLYYTVIGLVTLTLVGITKPGSLKILKQRPIKHFLIGMFMAVMVVTHFLAIAQIEAAYMISVKRSSLLFGILFGALLFNEQHAIHHIFAGALMVLGVGLIIM